MIFKNTANQGVYLFAYDTDASAPKTGDASNITGKWSLNGAAEANFTTANPTEIGGGIYWQPLSQAETNGNAFAYRWTSSTANVVIEPVIGFTEGGRIDAAITSRLAAADVPNNFKDLAITETEGKVTVDNVDDCKATGFSTHSPEDVKSAIESEGSKLSIVHSKLPTYGIADQSLLTAIGNDLVSHRNNYTTERAAKLDNLDATISSRLAASAAPAHFGDLAITETTGKVTVDNVDDCKADVSGLATSAEIAALNDFDPATEKVEIAGTKNRLDDLNDIDGSSVTVTTNNDKTGYALTTGERSSIATAVWSATTRTLSSFGTLVADMVTGVWGAMTRTLTAGTRDTEIDTIVGKLPAGGIAGQTTLDAVNLSLTQHRGVYTTERAAKLDNLDVSISSRLAATGYTAPPTVDAIVAGVESEQGKLHETLVRAENTDELMRELTEVDGAGNHRLTAKALEQAPVGESVWSTEQRDAVLEMASTRLVTQSRINTTTTPWRLELLVDQTIVKAYACYDINGEPITSTDAIIAKYVEVV